MKDLDEVTNDILSEQTETKDTIAARRVAFENQRTECEQRIRAIKSFIISVHDFLHATKANLVKMVTEFDERQSKLQLGPLMPVDGVSR